MEETAHPGTSSSWTVEVSDAEIRAARALWAAARDGDAPAERVASLHEAYADLVRRQSRQIAEAFRRRHGR